MNRITQQLGNRLLMRSINELKKFTLDFDRQVTEIKMIRSGGPNSKISNGDVVNNIFAQAKTLKTSFEDVGKVQASLYRQGLSDSEVNSRTSDIIKFSKVTNTDVTKATKYLTTAVNSGLVSSLREAMDVMAALGDTAATTAEEIAKGMQKSAASANMVGVSFNSLTAMLTAITAGTQLGGTVAGTALNTMFSRINRVTSENFYKNANGESVYRNDVEKALRNVGIESTDKMVNLEM